MRKAKTMELPSVWIVSEETSLSLKSIVCGVYATQQQAVDYVADCENLRDAVSKVIPPTSRWRIQVRKVIGQPEADQRSNENF